MKALAFMVGEEPTVIEIENTLEALQKFVGGFIECIPYDNAVIICNEEARLKNLPFNRTVLDRHVFLGSIFGDYLVVNADLEGDFCDLTDKQIEEYARLMG